MKREGMLFLVLSILLSAAPGSAQQQPEALIGFIGKVELPTPNVVYEVDLYEGSSSNSNFYATRRLITSTRTDADGTFLIVVSNPPLVPLTIRAKNSASRTGGDSVQLPPLEGWPQTTTGVDIVPTSQADPRFGIATNNYARQRMYFVTDREPGGADFQNTIAQNEIPSTGSFLGHVALGPGQAVPHECGIARDWVCDGPQITNDDAFVDQVVINKRADAAHSALAAALAAPAGNTILLFVHGYNNSFDQGAATAARLSYLMEPTPHLTLFYSWPSQGKVHGYPQDKNNADKSAKANLIWVLDQLSNLQTHPRVILVGHSMGSYALTTALWDWGVQHAAATAHFDQLILFAADLDVSLWKQTYEPVVGRIVKHIKFYGNQNDQALRASKCTTGDDVDRVGQIAQWRPPPPPPAVDLTGFDATPYASTNDFGHGYVTSSLTVALNWNATTDSSPMPDLRARVSKLGWLQDGGGGPINWGSADTTILCNIWAHLP
jgi:esterase/lipase superfamily enzyme